MIKALDLVSKFRQALSEKWGYIWGAAGILWTEARQQEKVDYMVSKYGPDWKKNADAKGDNYYGAAVYGSKWIGHKVADCSGLFVWAFSQLGGSIYHGSNTIYDRYCTTKGKITDEIRKSMVPGTAVFVCKASGNKSHIGLYVGDGKVIEASGTQAGVCVSNLTASKWTYYGLLKGVTYDEATDLPPVTEEPKADEHPTLRKGSKGEAVKTAQKLLMKLGYSLPKYGADGDFGSETEKAVKEFQKDHGLTADGVVGPLTWKALLDEPAKETKYSVIISNLDLTQARALCDNYPGAIMKEMEE